MAQWYYGSSAGQNGPVEEQELRALIASGGLGPETLVWREGMKDWLSLRAVPELASTVPLAYAPPGAPGYPQAYYPPVVPNSGMAISSLVCGITSLMICGILGIPAVICGHMALTQIRDSPVPVGGRGMAIAGLVMGYLGVLACIAMIVFLVIAFAAAPH
jgi:hypothetical protein